MVAIATGATPRPKTYTLDEVAQALRVHTKTAARWVREGRIRAVKIGAVVRVSASELDRLTGASQ